MTGNEEEKKCPLCAEEMDWTDQQLKPCKCGYEVCVWCWNQIMDMAEKDATEGRCPACRSPYDKTKIVGLESNIQRVPANNASRKQKQPKPKQNPPDEGRKDLSNVRVIQRKMAYIFGLPLSLADEDLLQRKDYFGQYGKITKVALSRTAGGTIQQFGNDTSSVYITYSKEEEAVRCIKSVHGYMLDGWFLRASFGTAKYCHAWLRNMRCNNVACLYLHSIGAKEDSFHKDETAAVHTRNRVQEVVGAIQYLRKRSGSMLPPPVDENSNSYSTSAQEPILSSGLEDIAYATVACDDYLSCSKEKDGVTKPSKHMTSFVDVGRSCISGSDKDISTVSDGQMLNLCSDMPSICIDWSNRDKVEGSDSVSSKSSTSKFYSESLSEDSRLSVEQGDLTHKDTKIANKQSGLALDSENSLNHDGEIKNYSEHDWWHMESELSNQKGYGINNYTESILNDGNNEKTFESFAKSDRIYGGSKSFNEEIVEQLRRLDDDSLVNDDENSAAVESTIISNILSMDFDGCDDLVLPQTLTGLFEGKDGQQGSSWNFHNTDQSRFSFANEKGHTNEEGGAYKPLYQVKAPRIGNAIPPGFSKTPPGFSTCAITGQVITSDSMSGSYVKASLPKNHYHMPSIGNLSNISNDLNDPAIMAVGRGNSLSFDTRSSSFDEEKKLWLLMQHQSASATHHHKPQTSFMQQSIRPQFPSSGDGYYGDLTSRLVDQSYTQQQQYLQPKFTNGHITNGYQQPHLDEAQQVKTISEVGGLQGHIQRNERLGLDKLLPGYGDYRFQMPSSGDVYSRVIGM